MKPYYSDSQVTIYHGDCRDVLPTLEPVETCITDPPYGLSFMGKDWDHGVPGEHFWRLILHALLPGAMCLAFGGTRTHHRLMCGMEDAGFELRDCLMWLYGSGFPKSLDVGKSIDKTAGAERDVVGARPIAYSDSPSGYTSTSENSTARGGGIWNPVTGEPEHGRPITAPATEAAKLWNGWGTALKPAWEPIILAMKHRDGTFAQNALEHGVAGLNVDGARIEGGEIASAGGTRRSGGIMGESSPLGGWSPRHSGRWPANLVLDEGSAALLDEQSGELNRGATRPQDPDQPSNPGKNTYGKFSRGGDTFFGDVGGASRFFYCAKASAADRGEDNDHPTVKPSKLMIWLCRLTATPTGGTILDPFMGSGTTLKAAKIVGRKGIGIDEDERSCEIAAARMIES